MHTNKDINEIKSQETTEVASPLRRSSRIAKPTRTIVTRRLSNISDDNSESETPRRTRRSKHSFDQSHLFCSSICKKKVRLSLSDDHFLVIYI